MSYLKRNLKLAFKNFRFNIKTNVCFIILLVLLQSLFSCILILNYNNNGTAKKYLEDTYYVDKTFFVDENLGEVHNYHVIFKNLNTTQYLRLKNYNSETDYESEFFYIVYDEKTNMNNSGAFRYDVYIYFYSQKNHDITPQSIYNALQNSKLYEDLENDGNFDVFETPLLTYDSRVTGNNAFTAFFAVLLLVCGTVMFTVMYKTIINHNRFIYGIYMTFGATFRKLFESVFWEMSIINIITFIPSFLVSLLLSFTVNLNTPYSFGVFFPALLLTLLYSTLIIIISLFSVTKNLSVKAPAKLISSVDNVSLISSPRRSDDMLDFTFPRKLEMLTFKRFRKYSLKLILSTMLFASMFVCGVFLAGSIDTSIHAPSPQFVLKSNSQNVLFTSELQSKISALNGVSFVEAQTYTDSIFVGSYVRFNKKNLVAFQNSRAITAQSGYGDLCNARYLMLDESEALVIESRYSDIEGNLADVYNNSRQIAISSGYNNSRKFKLNVGDTVQIAVSQSEMPPSVSVNTANYKDIMQNLSKRGGYIFCEFTVAAIIDDIPTGSLFPIYFNQADYNYVSFGGAESVSEAFVYCDDGCDYSIIKSIEASIRALGDEYDFDVTDNNASVVEMLNNFGNSEKIVAFLAVLFLLVAVLILLLTQILFYSMRKKELDVYLCMGAVVSDIKKLFIIDGVFYSVLSLVSFCTVSLALHRTFYSLINYIYGQTVKISYTIPWAALAVGAFAVIAGSIISLYIAYINYMKTCSPIFTGSEVSNVEVDNNANS